MGHYDNCRDGNCPVCGQTEGYCEHTLEVYMQKQAKQFGTDRRITDGKKPGVIPQLQQLEERVKKVEELEKRVAYLESLMGDWK